MNGSVDSSDRALLVLQVRSKADSQPTDLTVWIDTAFTGDLVIPRSTILRLGFQQSAAVAAGLADGTQVILETFSCIIRWFEKDLAVEVVENDGQFPLLGVGLLKNRRLEVNYRLRKLSID